MLLRYFTNLASTACLCPYLHCLNACGPKRLHASTCVPARVSTNMTTSAYLNRATVPDCLRLNLGLPMPATGMFCAPGAASMPATVSLRQTTCTYLRLLAPECVHAFTYLPLCICLTLPLYLSQKLRIHICQGMFATKLPVQHETA